jgi:hypothetical protein
MIKEFYPSGAISELLHLKAMHAVCRVRIKELEHLILEREQSAAVSYPGNSASEQSDSESTTGDCQDLNSLRSPAYGGGSGGAYGTLELPKRSNNRRGWVRLHAALGADRDKLTPFERQRRYDQVSALGYIWPIVQEESISRVEGDGCPEDLTEDDTRGCVENLDEGETRECLESLNGKLSPLCRLSLVRPGDYIVTLCALYFYRLIVKLTTFLQLQEFSLRNPTVSFPLPPHGAKLSSQLKSKCGNILAKAAALRIVLNIDEAPEVSRSHTHPSQSQISCLLISSLSLGVPVPRSTQCT